MTSHMAEPDAEPALPLFGFCEERKRHGYYQHYTDEEKTRMKLRAYAFLACARRKGHDKFDGATGIGRVVMEFVGPFSWRSIERSSDKEAGDDPRKRELLRPRRLRERMCFLMEGCQLMEPKIKAQLHEALAPTQKVMDKEELHKAAIKAHEANPSAKNAEAVRSAEAAVEAARADKEDVEAARAAIRAAILG